MVYENINFCLFNRLAEMRAQKKKLSRQVRERDEELDVVNRKVDQLRQDLRKAEKAKHAVCCSILPKIARYHNDLYLEWFMQWKVPC